MQNRIDAIVSLTSYPARIPTVHKVIETLLKQTCKPSKIILWLGEEQFPNKYDDLPKTLTSLLSDYFQIMWCKDIRSYKKLIPALKMFPDSVIVTADDDVYYPESWLEKLYLSYLQEPDKVHAHRMHQILFVKNKIKRYKAWQHVTQTRTVSFNNFATGRGGILYPPNIFHKDIFREDLFLSLAPSNDDIWFWAMTALNGVPAKLAEGNTPWMRGVEGSQNEALYKINLTGRISKNDIQLANVFKHYPELLNKLEIRDYGLIKRILNLARVLYYEINNV